MAAIVSAVTVAAMNLVPVFVTLQLVASIAVSVATPVAIRTEPNVREPSPYSAHAAASVDHIDRVGGGGGDGGGGGVILRRTLPIMFAHNIPAGIAARGQPYSGGHRGNETELGGYTGGNSTLPPCTPSVNEFPPFFTEKQREQGALIVAVLIGLYCFTLIAVICDQYFLPCVERLCETFNLSQDVAAAVFMSMATSSPELFTNIVGTFVTESDIGLGTIIGSSMFNTLGVASFGGLAATAPIRIDWWPLSRDCLIYIGAILILVGVTWDGEVYWYEALILASVYVIYFVVMLQNDRIRRFFRKLCPRSRTMSETTITSKSEQPPQQQQQNGISTIESMSSKYESNSTSPTVVASNAKDDHKTTRPKLPEDDDVESLFKMPAGKWHEKIGFFFTWPIRLVLRFTVPNPARHPRLFPLTFILCVAWIGTTSYLVSWMVTVIGYTFGIPDSVLGLTFLAAGGCLPEAISLTIVSRRGEGSMGVSNALGANTMNILLSLGLPWLIKTTATSHKYIQIESGSIEYTILALILAAICLFVTLALNKFRLSRRSGVILIVIYVVFVVMAILAELVFFERRGCES